MKKAVVLVIFWLIPLIGFCQYYPNIVSYNYNGTPTTGVKIKTNIPFSHGYGMPLVKIQGYNYNADSKGVIDLSIVWYVYNDDFIQAFVSSSGNATPVVTLSNEGGKVCIHLDENIYYQRFYVSAFAKGKSEVTIDFENWTVVREAVSGSSIKVASYRNKLAGTISFPDGIWNSAGNVGIGTTTPDSKLSVNGKIRAHEIKLETSNWPDYVFGENYRQLSLEELEDFIKANGHLPGLKSAEEYKQEGVNMMELNQKLLEKVEELTLYTIRQEDKIKSLAARDTMIVELLERVRKLENQH